MQTLSALCTAPSGLEPVLRRVCCGSLNDHYRRMYGEISERRLVPTFLDAETYMHLLRNVLSAAIVASAMASMNAHAANQATKEDYVRAPMPPGFQVVATELEGPVFADAQGRTLYMWPKRQLRNGDAGEVEGKPTCGDEPYRENSGFLSPYPKGLEMPDADKRPGCTAVWPPVLALAGAKPIGEWTVVDRLDGRKQWAYKGWSLYTSTVDKRPGETFGGSGMFYHGEPGANRHPVGPEANVPGQFDVQTTLPGRLVVLHDGWSVYTYDGDGRNKSNCKDACLDGWSPVLAAVSATPFGEWSIVERAPGVKQWAFRTRPVYRHLTDSKLGSLDGSDVPRWHNVYTQMTPEPPQGFKLKATTVGLTIGDANGKSVYRYTCTDDAIDQLECDYPEAPQVYRFAVCGGGDPDRCQKVFPMIIAPTGAKSGNMVWGTMYIEPKSGKRASAETPGALNVWTFRGRPVYTFAGYKGYGDNRTTDVNAHGWGEVNGGRNGFAALIYRDIHEYRDGVRADR